METACPRVRDLLARGVRLPQPSTVFVGDEVAPAHIAADVVIHPGCRITGASTSIGPGCALGEEAPVTLDDCQLADGVELKGGFFAGAVFLDRANAGSGAHVRPGTILEEEASIAHTVGLKQTILLPFVTTGSLVNFCDCLMAGGTSRKNHSEVGSSYIHFNFTPHQDKATPSLIGDVPRGVMLDQEPIFLGGQGGLVGPARIGFGCVIPAGVVWRRDAPGDHMILYPPPAPPRGPRPYRVGAYRDAARIFRNNLNYIGNIRALRAWYMHVRAPFLKGLYHQPCLEGALRQLDSVLAERVKRLREFAGKLARSAELLKDEALDAAKRELAAQQRILVAWPKVDAALNHSHGDAGQVHRDMLLAALAGRDGMSYVQWVAGLSPEARHAGTAWLQSVVDETMETGRLAEGS